MIIAIISIIIFIKYRFLFYSIIPLLQFYNLIKENNILNCDLLLLFIKKVEKRSAHCYSLYSIFFKITFKMQIFFPLFWWYPLILHLAKIFSDVRTFTLLLLLFIIIIIIIII